MDRVKEPGRPRSLIVIEPGEIKRLIKLTGLTRETLATKLKVKPSRITQWIVRGRMCGEFYNKLISLNYSCNENRFIKVDKHLISETIKATGLTRKELGKRLGLSISGIRDIKYRGVIDRDHYHTIWSLTSVEWREQYIFDTTV
jgi:DNA-binding XRE family transcriptional regulator